jgi:hypothetical protein
MEALDNAVLAKIAGDVLRPALVEEIVIEARAMFEASQRTDDRARLRRELETVEREQRRLTEAIAAGADAPVLIERLRVTEARRREIAALIEAQQTRHAPAWREIECRVRQSVTDWRSLLTGDVGEARQGFRQLLRAPILFTPYVEHGRRGIRFEGRIGLDAIIGGDVVTKMASPSGPERLYSRPIHRVIVLAGWIGAHLFAKHPGDIFDIA